MPKIPIILTLVCFAVTMQHAYAEKPILCGTPSECYEYAMDKLQEAQELVKKQQEENQRLAKTIQDLSSTIQALANENKRLIKENQSAVSALQQKMAPVNISTDGKVSIGTTQSSHQLVVESQNENTLRLIGPSSRGSKAKLNFGDGDYVFLKEYEDDKLEIKANGGVKFTGRVNFTNLVDIESKGSLNAAQFKANQGRALYLESNGNDRSTLVDNFKRIKHMRCALNQTAMKLLRCWLSKKARQMRQFFKRIEEMHCTLNQTAINILRCGLNKKAHIMLHNFKRIKHMRCTLNQTAMNILRCGLNKKARQMRQFFKRIEEMPCTLNQTAMNLLRCGLNKKAQIMLPNLKRIKDMRCSLNQTAINILRCGLSKKAQRKLPTLKETYPRAEVKIFKFLTLANRAMI